LAQAAFDVAVRAAQRREPPHDRAKTIRSRERLGFEAVVVLPPKKMGQKGHSYISLVKGLAGVCLINDVARARTGQATAHGAYPL